MTKSHPLAFSWTLYIHEKMNEDNNTKSNPKNENEWMADFKTIANFNTIEDFWRFPSSNLFMSLY
jgi:hypothetical protein